MIKRNLILALFLTAILCGQISAQTYSIDWQVISGGGTSASSPSFAMTGTVGQTAVGR